MCCLECKLEGCTTDKLVTRLSRGPGGDGSGVIMRTKLYNLLKAVSGLTSTGPGSMGEYSSESPGWGGSIISFFLANSEK